MNKMNLKEIATKIITKKRSKATQEFLDVNLRRCKEAAKHGEMSLGYTRYHQPEFMTRDQEKEALEILERKYGIWVEYEVEFQGRGHFPKLTWKDKPALTFSGTLWQWAENIFGDGQKI